MSGSCSCPGARRATTPTAGEGSGRRGPARWAHEIELEDGTTAVVDEAYLSRAIADPSAEIRAGYDVTMPSNDLTDEEIVAVVDYIVSLNTEGSG